MSIARARQKRNRILSWLINLVGVLAFALILYLGGVEAWLQIVRGDWRYVLAALAATLLWNLIATYRWSLIAGQVMDSGTPCPFRYYFTYHMIGMFTGQVLPITVGMLGGRPVALSLSRGISLKRAGLSVFLDKLFDLILALLLIGPVALYLVDWISLSLSFGLSAIAVVLGILLLGWQYEQTMGRLGRLAVRLTQALARIPVVGQQAARRLPKQLDRLTAETWLPNRSAVQVFLLTLVLYSLIAVRLILLAEALQLDIPWHLLAMGVCVTQLTLIFSVTPGSVGFLEGGWGAVLGLGGLSLDHFTIFVIGRRAYVLVFTMIFTLLAFAWIRESPAHLFRAVIAASRQGAEGLAAADVRADADQNGIPSLEVR